jgi:hypothetical protein
VFLAGDDMGPVSLFHPFLGIDSIFWLSGNFLNFTPGYC